MSNTERRFKAKNKEAWSPITDYVAVRNGEGFVVRLDGTEQSVSAMSLDYCIAQVQCGNWIEIKPSVFDEGIEISHVSISPFRLVKG